MCGRSRATKHRNGIRIAEEARAGTRLIHERAKVEILKTTDYEWLLRGAKGNNPPGSQVSPSVADRVGQGGFDAPWYRPISKPLERLLGSGPSQQRNVGAHSTVTMGSPSNWKHGSKLSECNPIREEPISPLACPIWDNDSTGMDRSGHRDRGAPRD